MGDDFMGVVELMLIGRSQFWRRSRFLDALVWGYYLGLAELQVRSWSEFRSCQLCWGVGHLDARLVSWMHNRRGFRGGYFGGSHDYLEYSR